MSSENNKRQSLFSALLAAIFLLVAVGAHHNFSKKKLLSYEGDNIEVLTDADAEGDNDWEFPLTLAYTPGHFLYIGNAVALKVPQLSNAKNNWKKLSEQRLYILFHQLRTHVS